MAQYIYTLKPVRPEMLTEGLNPEEEKVIGTHFAYLSDLTDKGVVKLVGRTTETGEKSIGVMIFEAEDEAAARAIMENDPAVKENVLAAELSPFNIALMGKPPA
jgi:uncharacterized protein YciI